MSRETYIRGFCKAAEAAGVDPAWLVKLAAYGVQDPGYYLQTGIGEMPSAYKVMKDHFEGKGYGFSTEKVPNHTYGDVVLSKGGKPYARYRYSEGASDPKKVWTRMNLDGKGRLSTTAKPSGPGFDDAYNRVASLAKQRGYTTSRFGYKLRMVDKSGKTTWAQFKNGRFYRTSEPASMAQARNLAAGNPAANYAQGPSGTGQYKTKSEEMMANMAARSNAYAAAGKIRSYNPEVRVARKTAPANRNPSSAPIAQGTASRRVNVAPLKSYDPRWASGRRMG